MNRYDEIERIIRLIRDRSDEHVLRECIGKAIDAAYREGNRQRIEDQIEADLYSKISGGSSE